MTKKKKLLLALCAVVVIAATVVLFATNGKDKGLYAMPATETVIAREGSYQDYLDSHGYADVLSSAEIALDVFAFEKSEDSNAIALTEGVDTGDMGSITWKFTVAETAKLAGYTDPYHFSKIYKARRGIPPSGRAAERREKKG